MQHISQTLSTCTPPSSNSSNSAIAKPEGGFKTPLASRTGGEVFSRLAAQFGAKLLDHWAAVPGARDEWGQALADFHPVEIERGLRATRARAFVPTLGEFLQLCRPALDPETAWHEAAEGMREREAGRRGRWSHPAVYRAAQPMAWELRTSHHAAQRKRWALQLQREFAQGWGAPIPEPTLRITQQELRRGPPPPEIRARLAAIRAAARATHHPHAHTAQP